MKTRSKTLLVASTLCAMAASLQTSSAQSVIYIVDEVISRGPCRIVVPEQIQSDYQPHLAAEYRNGYFAGRRDAAWGIQRNSPAAFRVSGGRWESYFQEGYADGYDGRQIRH